MEAMRGRAFGALLLVFAFPNALPAIPGTSSILGMPLLFISAQMMLGMPVWLPRIVAARSMSRDDFANLVERVNPWLDWADRFTAPRLSFLGDPAAQRVIGAFLPHPVHRARAAGAAGQHASGHRALPDRAGSSGARTGSGSRAGSGWASSRSSSPGASSMRCSVAAWFVLGQTPFDEALGRG
jgi:hypothetical protein